MGFGAQKLRPSLKNTGNSSVGKKERFVVRKRVKLCILIGENNIHIGIVGIMLAIPIFTNIKTKFINVNVFL